MDTPLHEHDCDTCVFLGNYTVPKDGTYDLYYHPSTFPTVIVRYGSEGSYLSGLHFVGVSRELTIAYRRAHERGLVSEPVENVGYWARYKQELIDYAEYIRQCAESATLSTRTLPLAPSYQGTE